MKTLIILILLLCANLGVGIYDAIVNMDYYANCYNCNNPPVDLSLISVVLVIVTILFIVYVIGNVCKDNDEGKIGVKK